MHLFVFLLFFLNRMVSYLSLVMAERNELINSLTEGQAELLILHGSFQSGNKRFQQTEVQ